MGFYELITEWTAFRQECINAASTLNWAKRKKTSSAVGLQKS
jgi:hypothetical protein